MPYEPDIIPTDTGFGQASLEDVALLRENFAERGECRDPQRPEVRTDIWETLEPPLEGVIDLDSNLPVTNWHVAVIAADLARSKLNEEVK